jgi:uncharacterized protein YjbJ (UPF0337 family)
LFHRAFRSGPAILEFTRSIPRWRPNEHIPGIKQPFFQSLSTACRSFTGVRYEEQVMSMNKDQVKGRVKEAKGKIKEAVGNLMGNKTMEAKGKTQKVLGEAQAKFGDVKKDMKDATKGV